MHELARRADVAYSTVSRIEHGRLDPTTGMLARLLTAMGKRLDVAVRDADIPQLAALVDAWHTAPDGQDRPDWTRLRAFLDTVAGQPDIAGPSTVRRPPPSGSCFMDNLLAGIAEKVCDDVGLPPPGWTRKIRPLQQPWRSGGTPRMRDEAAAATPPQLARRGITMHATSLWRDPSQLGR